jgi:hypothetical protein
VGKPSFGKDFAKLVEDGIQVIEKNRELLIYGGKTIVLQKVGDHQHSCDDLDNVSSMRQYRQYGGSAG